jgi:nitroimidazol reductase NimA-like FMN-containing flavoprotein (pyridoxamine 5'-phosphate oxidase superfamily)
MSFHVRRKDKEITDPEVMKKILKSCAYVTIALSTNNQPYLVSLSHGYDETRNCLYFHCAREGKKLEYMRSNPVVWGESLIDRGYMQKECTHLFASVHFLGKVSLIDDVEEKLQAMKCMMVQLDKNPEALLADLKPERLKNTTIGRIDIEQMTGKKSKEITI